MLPILLQHIEVADHSATIEEERIARAAEGRSGDCGDQKMEGRSGGGYRREYR